MTEKEIDSVLDDFIKSLKRQHRLEECVKVLLKATDTGTIVAIRFYLQNLKQTTMSKKTSYRTFTSRRGKCAQ